MSAMTAISLFDVLEQKNFYSQDARTLKNLFFYITFPFQNRLIVKVNISDYRFSPIEELKRNFKEGIHRYVNKY